MRIFILILFWVLKLQVTKCQNFGGGGPSNFGYDASSACSKPYSRSARAYIENLPCDFKRQNWCTVAGDNYPWRAVRRFVQENHGLMRRMYGDENHISVIRSEIAGNDVEDQDMEEDARSFDDEDYSFEEDDREDAGFGGRSFTSRAFDDSGSRRRFSKFPNLAESPRTPLHPSGPRPTTTTTTVKPTTQLPLDDLAKLSSRNSTQDNVTSTEKTPPVITLAQIANIQNLSINEIPDQVDRVDSNYENLTELTDIGDPTTERTTSETGGTTDLPTTILLDREDIMTADEPGRNNPDEDQSFAASELHFRPRPEYRPPETKPTNMNGQLFQDVAGKDQPPPALKPEGVNACPVKIEVVTPFWANSTRGEILALLNFYPFEQYVHWEKCTDENKQMHCRDGCRCEQQQRLHRLLAYDPTNECRGIFSEWFRFPSCCVCRCYNLPVEFRVTSRSPRVQRPHRSMKSRRRQG